MQSALDRLVRKDLLAKRASASDRRARCYELTKKGDAVHAAIEAQDRLNMADMLSVLSAKDQAELARLLGEMASRD